MSKHVYPPWHGPVQKIIFVIAAILCISLPVVYGDEDNTTLTSTAVIVVLVLYFVFWAAFTLTVRFVLKSYEEESKLPVHTPSPAPPVLLHSPLNRDASPSSPAIKISSQFSSDNTEPNTNAPKKRVMIGGRVSEDAEDANCDNVAQHHHQSSPQKGLRFAENLDRHQYPPSSSSPTSQNPPTSFPAGEAVKKSPSGVKFSQKPGGLAGESIDSEESYPTFATYRQSQHTSFDMFAQRIRKAIESANAQQKELEHQEKLRQEKLDQEQMKVETDTQNSHSEIEPGLDGTLAPPSVLTVKNGRPRSSSTASIISNISEKIRLGSGFFSRAGRSRAGSDASTIPSNVNTPGVRLSFSGPSTSSASSAPSEPSTSMPSTTALAAMASAAAVASAMSLPRHSANFTSSDNPRLNHPLSQTQHVNDISQDHSITVTLDIPEGEAEKTESHHVQRDNHFSEKSISNDDRVHVLTSTPDVNN
ncbi:hypothetical protein BGZ76_006797 [Entomortierella beljakovae]|nr:hypothetical protein BGZ76_006797 [Entomortierella beljakovae]